MVDSDGNQDWGKLSSYLSDSIILQIAIIWPPLGGAWKDIRVWKWSKTRQFSVPKAYEFFAQGNQEYPDGIDGAILSIVWVLG